VQRLADRISSIFVPVILIVAVLTFAGWFIAQHSWTHALVIAVAALVVACPCALGLATPAAVIATVGAAARRGILFRDADAIERLANITLVAFDKTGTLTDGHPQVLEIRAGSEEKAVRALAFAAALERNSVHPIAKAIVRFADSQLVPVLQATNARTSGGAGIAGNVDGNDVSVGNARMMRDGGIVVPETDETLAYVAIGGNIAAEIRLGDRLRDSSVSAAQALRDSGVDIAVVSGDNEQAVRSAAEAIGATQWLAKALPQEKASFVQALQSSGKRVAFVGDGINDAPALAVADAGIAMGAGSEIALETAQVALLSDDPLSVETSIELARAGRRTLRQNLFWAFA